MFKPTESKDFPGFYLIPGMKNYVISKDGRIRNLVTGNYLKPFKMSNGYLGIHTIHCDDGRKVTMYHRMMALAFIDPEDRDVKTLQVNHIDGDKHHNTIDNLEWITPQENCIHAGATGLSPKCIPIDVRDCVTGEVATYPSFIDYARTAGMSKDMVRNRLLVCQNGLRVFPEWKQYRVHSDEPWPTRIDCNVRGKPDAFGRSHPIEVKDLNTGEITEYVSVTEAAYGLGTTPGVLFSRLYTCKQPILPGMKQVRYASDTEWIAYDDPLLESFKSRGSRPVEITDTNTGETKYFRTCSEAARFVGVIPTTLHERLKSDGKVVFSDGRTYRYFTETNKSAADVSWQ